MKAQKIEFDHRADAIEVGSEMIKYGLPKNFVADAVQTAFNYEGVYNLMKMWLDEGDKEEKGEIIAEIQDLIDDCAQPGKVEGVYVRFDDLESIAKNVRGFKDELREIVDKKGGIGKLSALTSIPQPSLSRFFNSASMPRRTTLNKIAKALGLSQAEIATEWSK